MCDSPYQSSRLGGGTVSSSAVRMLFIDRLQILTTCALRHGKRDGEKNNEMFRCGKLNVHVRHALVMLNSSCITCLPLIVRSE